MSNSSKVQKIQGRAVVLRGNDIDTDRIIPARFLRCVTFDGLGDHAFEDDRLQDPNHAFNQEANAGASVLVVDDNFGCGSSREHAPQALNRWGIRALVGGSFAEIFFGNCVALGIPCLKMGAEERTRLMAAIKANPGAELEIDIASASVTVPGAGSFQGEIPAGPQRQLLDGTWDALAVLLESASQIDAVASALPYTHRFQA
ncbi:MAG: 3-isopropylmalate dehydratase small subunit [Verrucomicrobiota bacterium]|jgi:3-isopropylmalate/(R)-2-methylmalate dehydratase small subunit|nr:3-isopropylmalate dehydratase small subunit [Verrucomicrobiota bacterium]MDD8045666.1 3-isopropylmalate dehydratase small subunit [Verrucomicrobiota bacterium]MDD8050044.1 3-isopropylmalate dehydratase small subunit [Verrucomicrobiota bacterium]